MTNPGQGDGAMRVSVESGIDRALAGGLDKGLKTITMNYSDQQKTIITHNAILL
jgi:hypothetical protein